MATANAPALSASQQIGAFWHSILAWLSMHSIEILIGIGVAVGIVALLHLVRGVGMRLCRRDGGPLGWTTIIGRAIAKTGNFFMVMLAARLVMSYTNAPPALYQTIQFLFIIATVFQVAIWVREIVLGAVEHRATGGEGGEALGSAMGIIRLLVTVVVFAIALIVVLDNLGVNVTGLVAGLGVGGIAIGLAAQGIFSDLFAALSILFDRPFRRGDVINYDTSGGTVEEIGLKTTRLRSATGEERIVSNAQLLNKEILNLTRMDYRRVKFVLGVIYQTPPEVALAIPGMLEEIVRADGSKFVRSGFAAFNASSLDFDLEFDVDGPAYDDMFAARHRIGMAILQRFNAESIEFAYPTQTSFTAAPDGKAIMPYPDVPLTRARKDPDA